MGDGDLYSKQHQAVEIRCETCHGDADSRPSIQQVTDSKDPVVRLSRHYKGWSNTVGDWMVVSTRDRKLSNVKVQNGTLVTLGKRSGRTFETPLAADAGAAHRIPGHRDRLACTACHSQWVPSCRGCHTALEQNRLRESRQAGGHAGWTGHRFQLFPEEPVLMVGPRGKIAPMLPQPERRLTALDARGNPLRVLDRRGETRGKYLDWEFTNPHGYSGANLAYAVNPHSVGERPRACADCHLEPETLGLGAGTLHLGPNSTGRDDALKPLVQTEVIRRNSEVAPDAKVTARGEPLAGVTQEGARPLNQEEIARILRVGNCIACHDSYNDPIYRDIDESYRFESTLPHRQLRDKILNQR